MSALESFSTNLDSYFSSLTETPSKNEKEENSIHKRLIDEMNNNLQNRETKSVILADLWKSLNGYYYIIPRYFILFCLLPFLYTSNRTLFSSFLQSLTTSLL